MTVQDESPTAFTYQGIVIDSSVWVNYTRRFNALNIGGLFFSLSNFICIFLALRKKDEGWHNFDKRDGFWLLNLLNYLFLFTYLITATSYRFCEGGIACATGNVVYPETFTTEMIAASNTAELWNIQVGHFIYVWTITYWSLFGVFGLLITLIKCLRRDISWR